MKANDIKPGVALNLDGSLCVVTSADHVKPGKGPAYVQIKIKSIATGAVTEKRLRTAEDVPEAVLDKCDMQYLYSDPTGHVFMNNETYDQLAIPQDLLGDAMLYIKPNAAISVLFYDEKPVSLELPTTVELTVTDTTPQPRGATATNQLKDATLETGLKTRVPPFIEIGELVRISTADASYMGRA